MSEEKKEDPNLLFPGIGNEPESTNDEIPSVEDEAREMGWVPKDEFDPKDGNVDRWVSAETFVSRKPLFDKIDAQKRELAAIRAREVQRDKVLKDFAEHHKKVAETEYNRAKEELKAARRSALEDGEHVLAEDIQDRIEALKRADVPEMPEPESTPNPDNDLVTTWIEDNPWYTKDIEMKEVADGIARAAVKQGKDQEEVLNVVSSKIKKLFPEHFEKQNRNPNKDTAPHVESRTNRTVASGKSNSRYKPTDLERRMAQTFVSSGLYKNVDEYYNELAKMDN